MITAVSSSRWSARGRRVRRVVRPAMGSPRNRGRTSDAARTRGPHLGTCCARRGVRHRPVHAPPRSRRRQRDRCRPRPRRARPSPAPGPTGALLLGDTHQLPIPDRSVDIAFAVTVCEFTADPARVFAELARCTRPGGRIVVGSLNRTSPWGCWNRRQFTEAPVEHRPLPQPPSPHEPRRPARSLHPSRRPLRTRGAAGDPSGGHRPSSDIGRRVVPWLGAFQVLTIQLPATGPDSITTGPQT